MNPQQALGLSDDATGFLCLALLVILAVVHFTGLHRR